MNYIVEINRFWDWATLNPLPTGQIALYMALLHINNKSNWAEWFQAPNQVLSILTGLSRSGILTARNGLKQAGLIDVRERGTKATLYCVIANSKQDGAQERKQERKQDRAQDGVQDEKQDSPQALYIYNNSPLKDKNININNSPPISPLRMFEQFWDAYPKQPVAAKHNTEIAYADAVIAGVGESELLVAAQNYSEACNILEIDMQYIKKPDNFLKENTFAGYLPGAYQKPTPKKRKVSAAERYNKGIMTQDYDMDALERELLGGGS